jgi:hypothetical protein
MTGITLLIVALLIGSLVVSVIGARRDNALQMGASVASSGVLVALLWMLSFGRSAVYLMEVATAGMLLAAMLIVGMKRLVPERLSAAKLKRCSQAGRQPASR